MNSRKIQAGVGILEVLIAVLVLAVSLLAIASLQTRSLQYNQGAYWRSQANVLAQDMLELLRVNRASIAGLTFNYGAEPGNADAQLWLENLQSLIPGGEGQVNCANGPVAVAGVSGVITTFCTVSIRWREGVETNELGEEAVVTFSYTTSI
jgi:type IV pilus assembly protein PilV